MYGALIQALDHIQSNRVLDRNILKTLTGDTFKLMAHSIASNNKTRKDKIQNALMPKYKIIASKSTPSATNLFGDKIKEEIKSLNEKITTIATTSRQSFLQRRGGHNHFSNQNKSRGGPPFKAYHYRSRQWQDKRFRQSNKRGLGHNSNKK